MEILETVGITQKKFAPGHGALRWPKKRTFQVREPRLCLGWPGPPRRKLATNPVFDISRRTDEDDDPAGLLSEVDPAPETIGNERV